MNNNFDMTYLTVGDDYFGPDFGAAVVYSNVRAGYIQECPNVGKFLSNLSFSVDRENVLMAAILDDGAKPEVAARDWLTSNADILDTWLDGVTSIDGGDAVSAVKEMLGK